MLTSSCCGTHGSLYKTLGPKNSVAPRFTHSPRGGTSSLRRSPSMPSRPNQDPSRSLLSLPASRALPHDQASSLYEDGYIPQTFTHRHNFLTRREPIHRNPPRPTRSRGLERKGARTSGGRLIERLHGPSRLMACCSWPRPSTDTLHPNSQPAHSTQRAARSGVCSSSSHPGKTKRAANTRGPATHTATWKVTRSRRGRIQCMSSAVHTTRSRHRRKGAGRKVWAGLAPSSHNPQGVRSQGKLDTLCPPIVGQ